MPDILIQCPDCSREYKVSEYATVNKMTCITCGAGLSRRPDNSAQSNHLRVKSPTRTCTNQAVTRNNVPDELMIAGEGPVVYAAPKINVHVSRKVSAPPRWVAWAVGALILAALIGFQYFSDHLDSYLTYYVWARNILGSAVYTLVVLLAFQDHLGQGALSLFIPPYTLLYTSSSVESGILRGAFYGIVIVLISEIYFLSDESLLLAFGQWLSEVIDHVDGLIIKAGESPI